MEALLTDAVVEGAVWDGQSWGQVSVPHPSAEEDSTSIEAVSPQDAWLGGISEAGEHVFVDHWNGAEWQSADIRALKAFVPFAGLVVAADDIWLAGSVRAAAGSVVPTMVHWNGDHWAAL